VVDLPPVIDSAIAMIASTLRRRAGIHRHYDDDLPPVLGDAHKLAQLFVNLLSNAANALGEHAEPGRDRVSVAARRQGEQLVVTVSDTGPGVSAEDRSRIFDPFQTTIHGSGGSGLGLAICHRIVSEHNGTIELESSDREGARFVIRLPTTIPVPRRNTPPSQRHEATRAARVLVIDDEPLVARSAKRSLRGHRVDTAGSGEEGMELLGAGARYDLVLCDLMMPGMSGIDLYRHLHEHDPDQARRLVIISAALSESARRQVEALGGRFLAKPLEPGMLRALVAEALTTE
jgi:CheY-like chemotaxis protein/anti-sigma regulatory factor (Ser/Thr protein kinase)